jgi:hypothetical protein
MALGARCGYTRRDSAADVADESAQRRARPCRGSGTRPHVARPVTRSQLRRAFRESTPRRLPCGGGSPSGPPQDVTAPERVRGRASYEAKAAVALHKR